MAIERDYWKKAIKGFKLSDYPDVESVKFPELIAVAFAVCSKECGTTCFIMDGGPQICTYCGKMMFRTLVRSYRILPEDDTTEIPPWGCGSDYVASKTSKKKKKKSKHGT